MLTAICLGVVSVIGGLLLSWHLGTAAGATVAGVAVRPGPARRSETHAGGGPCAGALPQ